VWQWRYRSTLSLTSVVDEVGGQRHAPDALHPLGKRPGTHCTGGWVRRRFVFTGVEKTFLPSPGLERRTVQPVASCCADCDIEAVPWYYLNSAVMDD